MEIDLRHYVRLVNDQREHERDIFTVFSKCYQSVVGRPCLSNRVAIDAEHYVRAVRSGVGPMIPDYVKSHFDKAIPARMGRKLPEIVQKDKRAGLRLVDDSPVLMARKQADGVWRC